RGRVRLAREELLTVVDDRLVRDWIVPPRLPGARCDADQIEDAERLRRLQAFGAELRRRAQRGSPVDPAAEEDPARGVAGMVALGIADRVEAAVVRAREHRGGVAAGTRTLLARSRRKRLA